MANLEGLIMAALSKAHYINGMFVLAEDGEYDLPVSTELPHRFSMVDDEVVDLYDGVDDDGVRLKDWEDGVTAAEEAGETPPPDYRIPSPTE